MNPMNASNNTAAVTVHFSNASDTARLCGSTSDGRSIPFNAARSASGIKRLNAWAKRNSEGWTGHMCAECCKARLESV
jgi:hypothetical protein